MQIVRDRIQQHLWRDGRVWNNFPGGLVTLPDFADSPTRLPWNQQQLDRAPQGRQEESVGEDAGGALLDQGSRQQLSAAGQFTALIYAQQMVSPSSSGPLLHLLRVVSKSQHVARVRVAFILF